MENKEKSALKKEEPIIIYEVVRVYGDEYKKEGLNKKPHEMVLFLKEHIKRMENSFNKINEKFPMTYEQIKEELDKIIKEKENKTGNIKLCYNLSKKEFSAFYIPHYYPNEDMYIKGVKVVFYKAERENPTAKIIHEDLRKAANEKMKNTNSFEVILVDHNGYITEGSKSNIFMIKDNTLITSPTDSVLPGITRMKIIEVAKSLNIPFKEEKINYKDINTLDAMFISGTSPKVLPISLIEDIKLDVNNSVMKEIMKGYDEAIKNDLNLK